MNTNPGIKLNLLDPRLRAVVIIMLKAEADNYQILGAERMALDFIDPILEALGAPKELRGTLRTCWCDARATKKNVEKFVDWMIEQIEAPNRN